MLHNWQAMASFLVAALMISYAVGPICLMSLRKQLSNHARPFCLHCGGLIAFIGFYVCTAGVYWAGLSSIKMVHILTILGLALYLFYYQVHKRPLKKLDSQHALWLFCYIFGIGVFSYYGNYGGKQLITLYWDLLFLLGFSLTIFILALLSTKNNDQAEHAGS